MPSVCSVAFLLLLSGCKDSVYTAGTYMGEGQGYSGIIRLEVTVSSDSVETISVVQNTDSLFAAAAVNSLIEKALSGNSMNFESVSGASLTSRGIIAAVENARASARAGLTR